MDMRPVTRLAILVAFGATVAACDADSELVSNLRRWKDVEPSEYTFQFQRSCFCAPVATQAVRIFVQDGQVVDVRRVSDGQQPPQQEIDDLFTITIDSLFGIVSHAIEVHAAHLDVVYDPRRGYPLHAQIDYVATAADEELSFTAAFISPTVPQPN